MKLHQDCREEPLALNATGSVSDAQWWSTALWWMERIAWGGGDCQSAVQTRDQLHHQPYRGDRCCYKEIN